MEEAYFDFSGQLTLEELKASVECLDYLGDIIDRMFENGELQGYVEKTFFYKGLEFWFGFHHEEIEEIVFKGYYDKNDLKKYEEDCNLNKEKFDWKSLADTLLNNQLNEWGIHDTLVYLIEMDFLPRDLINVLGFSKENVEEAVDTVNERVEECL